MPAVQQQLAVDLHIGPQWVPTAQWCTCAVDAGLAVLLFNKAAKEAVPNDENAAVVFVQVPLVHGVVSAVVAGAAKPAVKPTQLAHLLRVHPKLVEQVDECHGAKHQGRHTQHSHGQVKNPAEQKAAAGLAQCRAQVVVLALVVHRMRRPQQPHAVAGAVQPVVAKVVHQQGNNPHPQCVSGQAPQGDMFKSECVKPGHEELGKDAHHLAHDAQADAVQAVGQAIGVATTHPTHGKFQRDEQQEHGHRQDDDLRGFHRRSVDYRLM